ncbi:MAG: ABC transporter ATP-binding protein [Thermoplasmata archaeon]|nr:ABC transporter ATP-binding protein [Thermoplasmata archaeon]
MIEVKSLKFSYNDHSVLKGISFIVKNNEILGILGPNGSGKTTLLNLIGGILKKKEGEILINGKKIENYSRKELARIMAFVPQDTSTAFDFNVFEIVSMGRYPHLGIMDSLTEKDKNIIIEALKKTEIYDLRNKSTRQISGGERQRVFIARAIAQDPEIILLDEPTSNLDIKYQIEILDIIERMRSQGKTILMSMHDVNLAVRYCTKIALIHNGNILAFGEPENVINEKNIEIAYGIKGKIIRNGGEKIAYILPEKFNGF